MSTQKRRVIYMTDEMWASAKRRAEMVGLSVSDWLRGMVTEDAFLKQERAARPEVALSQDIAEDVLYVTPRNLQVAHVPTFTPAPKPSAKKR